MPLKAEAAVIVVPAALILAGKYALRRLLYAGYGQRRCAAAHSYANQQAEYTYEYVTRAAVLPALLFPWHGIVLIITAAELAAGVLLIVLSVHFTVFFHMLPPSV